MAGEQISAVKEASCAEIYRATRSMAMSGHGIDKS